MSTMTSHSDHRLFAGGEWLTPHTSARIEVENPYTRRIVGTAPDGDAADIDAAVRAAREAFDHGPWPRMSADERATLLERLADELERRGADIADLVTDEIGQPTGLSRYVNGMMPAGQLRYFAGLIRAFAFEEERANIAGPGASTIRYEPVGVAGLIVPWNYPQSLLSAKLAPALAVGCTVVIKPAAETPLDALALAEAVEAVGFPPGVVNVVTGGRETGDALVKHPSVDKIAFTGSTAAGRIIARNCGERLIPVTLELGGKSAAIVLDDADIDVTLAGLRGNSFMNSGQTCFLLSRVLVPRSRRDEVVDGLVDVARSFRLGDPRDASTELGPLVSDRIRSRVRGLVDGARARGAQVLTGGRDLPGESGYFYEPTILAGVSPEDEIAQEEVFGPVVTVMEYQDRDDAVRIANDSKYGLGGAVFSRDIEAARDVARAVQTGTIGVNGYAPDLASPFGGYKASGLGREQGHEVFYNYLNTKSINVILGAGA
ncbi:aldehyde dehydrogenase [Microbacterium sp.]|jgi:aldehyde dehydrogenase (NAD+)|uniref:aldehyde dehydrogenase n=1 Tax=Microbacterium sp. TaxID=51671 RepID=UPI00271DA318|nr:aldehyde dehydrogenase [Microbacterium sp.]MDO8382952.1 aldehyde dehydrogenase [Microbacterium sp.]